MEQNLPSNFATPSYVMASRDALTHDDYAVAWICALPLEVAAAKVMLDNVHSSLPQPESDHNIYILGNIGDHNIVIICLPSGVYGPISAATAVSQMRSTFSSVRFGLMVGIGGGVPCQKADIRLGDVVVSMPTVAAGGVIPYDYGKAMHNGRFQRTAFLNKPPQILLNAVSQIRGNYMMREEHFEGIISATLAKDVKIGEQFARPSKDQLFKATYIHQSDFTDCSACDQTQLVDRPPRMIDGPRLHYGLIASGSQVMKDAETRDSIAHELDILCFEMEAAGLMDQLPCLVIRGICDYCDSHKHEEWQEYAALTATIYAKVLLSLVPVHHGQSSTRSRLEAENKQLRSHIMTLESALEAASKQLEEINDALLGLL